MKNRILRLALVVLAVAAQAAAGFFVFQLEQAHAAVRARVASLAHDVEHVQAMVGEMRGAHAGVVAVGQDPGYWVPKIATLVQDAGGALARVDRASLAPEAAQDLTAATDAIAVFGRTTDRVRDLLATDQPLTASALTFTDAAQQLSTAFGALANIGPTQAAAAEREIARVRLLEAYALVGAGGFTLLVLLVLLPRVRVPAEEAAQPVPLAGLGLSLAPSSPSDLDNLGKSGFDLDIPRVPGAPGDPVAESPHEPEDEIVNDLQRESQLRLNTEAQVDLGETARLCGDLARIKDSGELPAILGRAAEILDAAGIVLWIAEPGAQVLRPAASHGYSDHTMSKMKALPISAENAVCVAYRGGGMEIVRGTRERSGAIVSPINTSSGCVGAMAAEIRHGAESSPAVQSVAAIICAQLASLVAETTA